MILSIARPGLTVLDIEVGSSSVYRREFPATEMLSLRFFTDTKISMPIFSSLIYEDKSFMLMEGMSTKSSKVNAYEHSMNMHSPLHFTRRCLLLKDGDISFPFFGTLDQYCELIQQNIDRLFPSSECEFSGTSSRTYEMNFNGQDVYSVIQQLSEMSGTELEVYYPIVNNFNVFGIRFNASPLGRRNHISTFLDLKQGITEYSISSPNNAYSNRVYAFGASRNIDFNSYADTSLRPSGPDYREANVPFGRLWEKAILRDDIFPQFIGEVATAVSSNSFTSSDINFNLNSQLLTETAKVSFLSGDLVGYTFEVTAYNDATKQVDIKPITDDIDRVLPGPGYAVSVGDNFTFLDIDMPSAYIVSAESLLGTIAQDVVDNDSNNFADISAVMEKKWFVENNMNLQIGDDVNLAIVPGFYGIGRVIRLESPLEDPRAYNCVISKSRSPSRLQNIQIGQDAQGYRIRKEIQERKFQKYNNR